MTADARSITALVMDVDGVLTDGSIIYDDQGRELKRFFVRDGLWIKLWLAQGFAAGVVSSRTSDATIRRMNELGVTHVMQGVSDKGEAIAALARATAVDPGQMAFIGDDLQDLPAMRAVAYAIAPADADERVRAHAAYITPSPGGRGAVRDAVMHLLEAKGLLDSVLAEFTISR